MEINYLKSMEHGKMRYTLKILKGEQLNYFGKDPTSFQIIMKDNIISTNCLFSLIIYQKKYSKQNNSKINV